MANRGLCSWAVLCLWFAVLHAEDATGLRLPDCSRTNGAIELTENQTAQQTVCEGVTEGMRLEWAFRSITGIVTSLVTCENPNEPCSAFNDAIVTGARDSASSTLTFIHTADRGENGHGIFTVICRDAGTTGVSCPIDVINSPSDSEVSCSASANGWTVTLSCNISRAYSFRNRYTCDFRQGSSTGASVGQPSTYSTGSGTRDVSGACTSTGHIPSTPGNYTYYAIISPGAKVISVTGSVTAAAPNQSPAISCSNLQSGYLPENSQLACTCTTTDLGQPQGHLLVYRGSNLLVNGSYGDGGVEFGQASVSRSDNGAVFRCVLDWASADIHDTNFTLQVAYPPVSPTITFRSQGYPFLVGESPTAYCTLPTGPDSGNPPASLTFEGHIGSAGQSEVSVTLTSLTSADNERRVVCEARNVFTDYSNNTSVRQETALDVYYVSQTITTLQANMCIMTSSTTCIVKEGQRVRVNCSAHSNPPIATAAWQQSGDSVLDLIADRDTSLSHLCDVMTATVGSDDRLPLLSNISLTVLTTYVAEIQVFTTNNGNETITVNETDHVILTCTAIGRPTPHMQISTDSRAVVTRPQGPVTAEQLATLTYDSSDVTCDFAGTYTCQVDNGQGRTDTSSVAVFVTYTALPGSSVQLHLQSQPARDDLYSLQCDVTDASRLYWTMCNLTVLSVTQGDKGFYKVIVHNGFGSAIFSVQLDVYGSKGQQAARVDKDDEADQGYLTPIPPPAQQNDSEVYELTDSGMPSRTESQSGPSEYSTLKSSAIGLRSVYSSLTLHCNTQPAVDTGLLRVRPVYENTVMTDQDVYVNQQNQE